MEPAATAGPVQNQPSLTTLPREIRNEIYHYLVVSSRPIKVCNDHNSLWRYLKAGRRNNDINLDFLCHAVEGSEFAQEIYEFFRNNIFDCSCQDLCRFLTTATTRFNFQNNLLPTTTNHGCLKFAKIPWIRKVKIAIFNDVFEREPSKHLAYLLKCPRLQQVDNTVNGLDGESDKISPIDLTVCTIASVCRKIRNKIGNGVTVKVQEPRTKGMIGEPGLRDASWIWEEPSQKAKSGLGTGLGMVRSFDTSRKAMEEHLRSRHNA